MIGLVLPFTRSAGGMMPSHPQNPPHGYDTIHPYCGIKPTKAEETYAALLSWTRSLVLTEMDVYYEEHGKDNAWVTRVRSYCNHLLTGQPMPRSLRLDAESKRLVAEWVAVARKETGLTPPNRATKPKRKPRRKHS